MLLSCAILTRGQQVLYGFIKQIASYYEPGPIRDGYVAAAVRFRIPYWDWAAVPSSGNSVLPACVGGSPGVEVDGPNGTQRIANPLFSYEFNPLDSTLLPDFPVSKLYLRSLTTLIKPPDRPMA
jgi:tyrosinase